MKCVPSPSSTKLKLVVQITVDQLRGDTLTRFGDRFGPAGFPEVDFGETLHVPTPEQGGDGRSIDDYRHKLRSGMRSASGTMTTREEALEKHGKLTTD